MTVRVGRLVHHVTVTRSDSVDPLYRITSYVEDDEEIVKVEILYKDGRQPSWFIVERNAFLESIVRLWPENVAFQFPSEDM